MGYSSYGTVVSLAMMFRLPLDLLVRQQSIEHKVITKKPDFAIKGNEFSGESKK